MIQLSSQTGLNFQYTMMCLEANGWDLALAKNNYNELISMNPVSTCSINCGLTNNDHVATNTAGSLYRKSESDVEDHHFPYEMPNDRLDRSIILLCRTFR